MTASTTTYRWGRILLGAGALGAAVAAHQLPALGASGLLHPARRPMAAMRPAACQDATFMGMGVTLAGWRCLASGERRGTLVYLHGIADNRTSGAGIVERFTRQGLDVVAFDSRAHGQSEGDTCTYGFFEKQDLNRVLDSIHAKPIILIGTSLGAAVALQEAADDERVRAVVAAETFSDLRTVATERAPFFFTRRAIQEAFALAEQQGRFQVDAVSPAAAASRISIPVLLIHGAADRDTSPDHSRRVFAALAGPKRLILIPGAGHNGSLRGNIWPEIQGWVQSVIQNEGVDSHE